jgi:hypothetical protein
MVKSLQCAQHAYMQFDLIYDLIQVYNKNLDYLYTLEKMGGF